MAVKFTDEQLRAIELHDCNILVSAAAGSGKTAVLSERIAEMVCRKDNPVDIDRLLVVTFTKAAASEMRERISQKIMDRLQEDGANEHLQKQVALLHNAQITTIDSFCMFVIKNNFQDIGLEPGFRAADEGEMTLLKQDMLAELLEENFASGDEEFYHCVEYFCPNGKEKILEEYILNLYEYALSFPFPEEWLNERKKDYAFSTIDEVENSKWGQYLLEHLKRTVASACDEMQRAIRICEEPDGPYMYGEMLEQELEQMEKLKELDGLQAFAEKLPALSFGRLSSKKDESVSSEKRAAAGDVRKGAKKLVDDLVSDYFARPLEVMLEQAAVCNRAVVVLIELTLAFKKKIDDKKREQKMVDFSDMEHFALDILIRKNENGEIEPTETAREYRDHFAEVLIDEYQDSNLVQEYLLWAVSGEQDGTYNRFMVGDVKQSIYKFRKARPELFLEKYKHYEPSGEKCRIDLHKNFRSRKEVLDSVNDCFKHFMREELGGICYDEAAALYVGATYYPENEGCESELLLFEKPDKDADMDAKQTEALGIANRIKELKRNFKVTDKEGNLRPVNYSDIVVLLRSNTGWDETFRDVFTTEGIPTYLAGRSGYFATKEISDILHFLRMLDNPLQDISLFGVMKSVFGGFTDEEVALIKANGKEKEKEAAEEQKGQSMKLCLYDCIKLLAKNEQDDFGKKCADFLEMVAVYRKCASYMSILELLKKMMEDFSYMAYVAALPAGSKRLANVEMLLTKAAAYEKNSYYGLFHFVRYIEQLEKYDVDMGEAGIMDENADVVRIMSIHKSKGLEFPVTIVAGLSKKFNMQDTSKAVLLDMDYGIGVDYVDVEGRIRNKTMRSRVLSEKLKQDNLAEELRILYVAMTRAKEKLIMTGTFADKEKLEKKLEECDGTLSLAQLLGAGSFMDCLLPVFDNVIVNETADLELNEVEEGMFQAFRKEELLAASDYKDEEAYQTLSERFSYVYPHQDLQNLYTKTSVSELKKAALEEKEEISTDFLFAHEEKDAYVPVFVREKSEDNISGATRGSAMHRIMELLDFSKEYKDSKSIEDAMVEFIEDGRLSAEYAEAIKSGKICKFMKCSLAKRMQKADAENKLYREQPFVYGIDASRLGEEFPQGEIVMIQGIIDAFFEEEDGIVLMDYKTDVVGTPEELVVRYKTQIDYYEEAIEHLTGKKVKERILYSFHFGCEVLVSDVV